MEFKDWTPALKIAMLGGAIFFGTYLAYIVGSSVVSMEPDKADNLRTFAFIVAGFVGFVVAIWRAHIADIERRNAERRWTIQRFSEGAQMLTDENEQRQVAGVKCLFMLAEENPHGIAAEVYDMLEMVADEEQ